MIMGKLVELAIYFEVFGLGEDDEGNPDWAGGKLSLGKVDESELNYDQLVEELDKREILDLIKMKTAKVEDLRFITKEKFEEEYGEDSDNSEDLYDDGFDEE
jgi:hypothetical protein